MSDESGIASAPPLTIAVSGTNAVLKWPTNSPAGIFLQRSTNLNHFWLSNSSTPSVSGTNYSVTVPMTGQAGFFQLGSRLSTAKKFNFSSTNAAALPSGWQTNAPKTWEGLAPPPPVPLAYAQPTIDVSSHTESYYTYFNANGYEFGGAIGNTHDGWSLWRGGTPLGGNTQTNTVQTFALRKARFNLSGTGDGFMGTNGTTAWGRQMETRLHLHTPTNNSRFIVLEATARSVVLRNTLYTGFPFSGIRDWPFEQDLEALFDVWMPDNPCTNITPSLISIGAFPASADGDLLFPLLSGVIYDVTPAVSGMTDYSFNVTVGPHKIVPLTWSYHQMFHRNTNSSPGVPTLSDWQDKFDQGSELLGTDNDAKIPLHDPSVTGNNHGGTIYRGDDVPVYVEFNLTNGPTNYCFYTRSMEPVFPHPDFSSSNYFTIGTQARLDALLAWTDANVKIVQSIDLGEGPVRGAENYFTPPTSIVLAADTADAVTCVHEWGHSRGIRHRAEPDPITGVVANPGPPMNAVMGKTTVVIPMNKVNRYERSLMVGE